MENWSLSWSKLILLSNANIEQLDASTQGVYRLSREEGGKAIVFYVASTESLKNDLLNHLSSSINDCIKATINSYKCFFRYSIVPNLDVRNAAVKKMYKFYQPSCNTQEPVNSRDDIEVNLN